MEKTVIGMLQDAVIAGDLFTAITEKSVTIKEMDIHLKEAEKAYKIEASATLRKIKDIKYFNALCKTVEEFNKKGESDTAKKLLKDILVAKDENLGKFYEMMAYYFLISTGVMFAPQIHISSDDCYKRDKQGYEADGIISEWNCVFDVKMFGIVFPHIITAENKLQEKVNKKILERIEQFESEVNKKIQLLSEEIKNKTDEYKQKQLMCEVDLEKKKLERMIREKREDLWSYVLKIDGNHGINVLDMKKYILGNLDNLAEKLAQMAWDERIEKWENTQDWESKNLIRKHGLGFIRKNVDGTTYTCSLYSPISMQLNHGFITKWHTSDIYEWALNNRFYFMHDASQFVRSRPYMIICVFDKESSGPFLQFTDGLSGYFRALCRRIFMDLNRMTDRNVDDGKAIPVSISEASKKITGILFLETSAIAEGNWHDYGWVYFNPNADNPLMEYQKNHFHNCNVFMDNFRYDNY